MTTVTHVPDSIKMFLDSKRVKYDVIHHRRDFTALETAADTNTPGIEFAKTVLVWVGDHMAMAVLPAHKRIDLWKFSQEAGGSEVTLAMEKGWGGLFPDCELGAEPPLGTLYHMPVYVSKEIDQDRYITFNAGTHEDVIRMPYADYKNVVQPLVADFCEP
jgi:Ala-tRNA(Pro) deacylase